MEKQRVNMDLDKELWKQVGIKAIEWDLQKKEIVEIALKEYIKNYKEMGKMNFKNVGTWWADREIELVEIDGKTYALNGWNGESFIKSWECTGEELMDASEKEYKITPITEEVDGDFEVIGYEVQ